MPPRRRPPAAGQAAASPALHPEQYVQPFLHYLEAECGMSLNTVAAYRVDLTQFIEWGQAERVVSVLDVDLNVLAGFVESLHARDLKATTIARRLVALKMFFRYLVLEGVVAESTVELLSSPKLWRYLPTVLSPENVDKLLDAPGWADQFPLRDRAVLALLYATGCRASEVSGMRVTDAKLEQNFCRCLGKGNKERIVSLNPVAVEAIQKYLTRERPLQVRLRDSEYLFVTRTGRPLTRINIWQLVKKYSIRSGCGAKISPHTLRHSFATHMLAGGAEIRALQEMLGHASIRTTQIYTQVEHSRLKAIHAKCHPRG
ncbi:site-specific tyrosine recombinase XerD [Planctomicrobium piriforme]|uniref:Tyrosine recombinase XerC n=1 Tax=Planctomicrobium piriforme TaxID=1576369 RepID=A0A1I3ND00_9PLAN|nr:site-specific tyrosine recombinase XerD [Planctomicrobium piriforme]SFJ07042.1 integrase/recombinase XerD [Planctomicrobium piriforme]